MTKPAKTLSDIDLICVALIPKEQAVDEKCKFKTIKSRERKENNELDFGCMVKYEMCEYCEPNCKHLNSNSKGNK